MRGRAIVIALLVGAIAAPAFGWIVRLGKLRSSVKPVIANEPGDVFAGLRFPMAANQASAAVVKLDRSDGHMLWKRSVLAAGRMHSDSINDLALAPNGDVIAAGGVLRDDHADFFVTRLASRDGAVRWRRFVDRPSDGPRSHEAQAVALDSAGDVFAAGELASSVAGAFSAFAVVKIDGRTGEERWRFTFDNGFFALALAVAVDPSGDVLAAGQVETRDDFTRPPRTIVVKLSSVDGALAWSRMIDGIVGALAADGAGNAIVAGGSLAPDTFGIAKLSGATGETRWERGSDSGAGSRTHFGDATVLPGGDVVAMGSLVDASGNRATMQIDRLEGSTGATQWHTVLPGEQAGSTVAVALGPGDTLRAAGSVRGGRSCDDGLALSIDAATGAVTNEHRIDGRATSSVCDAECVGDERPPCGPPRAGIDWDRVDGMALDARGRPLLGGTIYDDRHGRGRGFVARLP